MKKFNIRLTTLIDKDTDQWLRRLAETTRRTRGSLVKEALEIYLKRYETK